MNAAIDEVENFADLPDTGARDALNLVANFVGHRLDHPDATVEQVIEQSYDEASAGEVRSWIEGY